jgi:hypothetical protein
MVPTRSTMKALLFFFQDAYGGSMRKKPNISLDTLQRRNLKTNIGITFFPILICVLLVVLQNIINNELDKPKYKCGCVCVEAGWDGRCARKECGIQYSTIEQVGSCPIPSPQRWPALIQVPRADFRAVRSPSQPFSDLPDPSCRDSWSCPATVLVTGKDPTIAESMHSLLVVQVKHTSNNC